MAVGTYGAGVSSPVGKPVPGPPVNTPYDSDTAPDAAPDDTDPWQPTVDLSSKDAKNEKAAAKAYDQIYGGSAFVTNPDGTPSAAMLAQDAQNDEAEAAEFEALNQTFNVPGLGAVSQMETTDPADPASYGMPTLTPVFTTAPDLVPTPAPAANGDSASITTADLDYAPNVDLAQLRATELTLLQETSALLDAYDTLKTIVQAAVASNTVYGQEVSPDKYDVWWAHPSQYDAEATAFANQVNPQQEQLVQESAGAIEMFGQYIAMFNVAGQMYAEVDATALKPWTVSPVVYHHGHGPVVNPALQQPTGSDS